MGRPRRLRLSRTALAALLVAVAVALPIVTWWVAGGRLVAREAELERKGLATHSYKYGLKLAKRVADRLESLRAAEAERSFSHYQNLFHDTKGVAEGLAVTVSPLAGGPANPDISMHFQIDEDGRLTVPTVNEQFPELGIEARADCAAISALEEVAIYASNAALADDACPLPDDAARRVLIGDDSSVVIHHVEELSPESWRQHLEANALYRDLKLGRPRLSGRRRSAAPADDEQRVFVVVGDFSWFTLPVDGRPELVALRTVETPEGRWTQGFVINRAAIDRVIDSDDLPAAIMPEDLARSGRAGGEEVAVAIEETPWAVVLDLGPGLAGLAASSAKERHGFLRILLLCAAAAGLAGAMVVMLVQQTDRLATQRAQFAASAAHELRTPLAGLRLYGEMLAEGLGDPARSRHYAHRLAGEAERLGRVVSNVLSFTRLERSMLRVDTRVGDLAARVREIMERLEPALAEAGVELAVSIDDVPQVRFDRDAVGHIVQNLVDNAEKYTREVAGRRIEVAVGNDLEDVHVSVSDNGPGIGRSLRRRLFRPFTRGDDTGTAEGLGLGLVLVRALTRAQGGEVDYQDAPGGGARFVVRFPRLAADAA